MENDQIPKEMDLQALLASINSNFEAGLATNSSENRDFPSESMENPANSQANAEKVAEESPQNPEKLAGSPQKTNVFTVVRAKPEEFEDLDPLLSTLERIKPVNSLLTNEECTSFSIETQKVQLLFEQIQRNYEKKLGKVAETQKRLFDTFYKLKSQAQTLQNLTNSREIPLTKAKSSEKEKKFREIRSLDQDCEKSKFYLLSIVHRLEALETNLDRLIDHNLKKSKGN